jgi:hypothetical protein
VKGKKDVRFQRSLNSTKTIFSLFNLMSLFFKKDSYEIALLSLLACASSISSFERELRETWYVHQATRGHINGALHKSVPSIIPTLQSSKYCSDVCISPHLRPSQLRNSFITAVSNTNTAASQIIEVIALLINDRMNRSNLNFVGVSCT